MSKNKKEELNEEGLKNQETVNTEAQENSDSDTNQEEAKVTEKKEEPKELPPPTCEEELESYKDKHLRMYSEFENFRRRSAKERIELMQNAGQEIITTLLPILDDFDRAKTANADSDDVEAIKEGMDLIYTKIFTLLSQKGLKPMDAMGKDFNSDDYEAIAKIPAPSKDLKGKVIDVTEKGYYLNSKIIRYAKVVIGE